MYLINLVPLLIKTIQLCVPHRINAHDCKKVVNRSDYSNLNKETDSPTHGQTHVDKREKIPL